MKIICVVKFVPDVENFIYDYEKNVLVRENVKLILNPDDSCALAFALKMKELNPNNFIEIVSMAPKSAVPLIEDLLRLDVDRGTIISDKSFAGSDTYVTSKILGKYLKSQTFDCLLTGSHAQDGDTSHVPAQLGELLELEQMSGVTKVDLNNFTIAKAIFEVESETIVSTFEIALPAILSIHKDSKYKLPYVKYEDLELDVTHKLNIISDKELGFNKNEVGIEGSLTKVIKTYTKQYDKKSKVVVTNDEDGINEVYTFLKNKGYV